MSIEIPTEHNSYIGDGVYVSYDGYMIWLRTERENGIHFIALEPDVLRNLLEYRDKVYGHKEDE